MVFLSSKKNKLFGCNNIKIIKVRIHMKDLINQEVNSFTQTGQEGSTSASYLYSINKGLQPLVSFFTCLLLFLKQ